MFFKDKPWRDDVLSLMNTVIDEDERIRAEKELRAKDAENHHENH